MRIFLKCLAWLGGGIVILVALICFALFWHTTSTTPGISPPNGATNVHFREYTAWQTWDYEYRFDAPPEVCVTFAVDLMKRQSFREGGPIITKSEFTKFPIGSNFQPWFDVASVKNGILISGDNWIYAVVDKDRGRLYYFNSH